MNTNMKGGVLMPAASSLSNKEVLMEYIKHSRWSKLSNGAYGVVFQSKLETSNMDPRDTLTKRLLSYLGVRYPPVLKDMYKNIRFPHFGKPVRNLCVKICLVSNASPEELHGAQPSMRPVSTKEFRNEINVQTDIYLKTMLYLQPLCPGIVYADILPPNDPLISALIVKNVNLAKYFHFKQNGFTAFQFGVIAMELMEEATGLLFIDGNFPEDTKTANIERFALLELALQTGYNHNDFHANNLLLMEGGKYFDVPTLNRQSTSLASTLKRGVGLSPGKSFDFTPLIVDFGRATKLDVRSLSLIRKFVEARQYTEALKVLCLHGNAAVSDEERYRHYGWVCGNYQFEHEHDPELGDQLPPPLPPRVNEHIGRLFRAREAALNKNTAVMARKHARRPANYPLLPLGNRLKNNMFSGLFVTFSAEDLLRSIEQKKQHIAHFDESGRQGGIPISIPDLLQEHPAPNELDDDLDAGQLYFQEVRQKLNARRLKKKNPYTEVYQFPFQNEPLTHVQQRGTVGGRRPNPRKRQTTRKWRNP